MPVPLPIPLIERRRLFGNPSRAGAEVSPDGRWLSWLEPRDGVLNIFVAPVGRMAEARPLTKERTRPIREHHWSADSRFVLFVNDAGGDENFRLFGVSPEGGEVSCLTPFDQVQARILKISRKIKDRLLIGLNRRDARWHDVFSLDPATGDLSAVFEGDGFAGFLIDQDLNLMGAARPTSEGGMDYFEIAAGEIASEPVDRVAFEDAATTQPLRFTNDGRVLYWIDSRGLDAAALLAQDMASGERRVIAADPAVDIAQALFSPRTGEAEAYVANRLAIEWRSIDGSLSADLAFLREALEGEFSVASRSDADDLWIVGSDPVAAPTSDWLYHRSERRLERLFTTRPELEGAPLAPMHALEIASRDGLSQVSYLTLPTDADPERTGRPASPVPMVLLPHGGPWARDVFGYNPFHQFLANRGYAVLSPNFRGSTGFGKAHLSAGWGEWGATMHDDLIDAVEWAIGEGICRRDKVAILGGSYGGYAVLAGLAFTPEVFACGVDIVGPSNLLTLLASVPPYWAAIRNMMARWIADPETEEGRAALERASPLTRAGDISKPLLIAQGANDPRVKKAESDQIVEAMREKAIPVTYLLFPDEGHGFARPENNIAFIAVAEHFLAEVLGGRAEPYGDALASSSLEVEAGAEFAPGLQSALAAARD
ncbi:MAG: S9 family peptidase [Caulobacteraceae bacterium]